MVVFTEQCLQWWKFFSLNFSNNQHLLLISTALFLLLARFNLAWSQKTEPSKNIDHITVHLFAVAIPVIVFLLLYIKILDFWFMADDPCHLKYIANNGLFAAFYDLTRIFSFANFTPWEPFSLGIDFKLFKLNPAGYYWHHLLVFSAALPLAYSVLSRYFPPIIISFVLTWFVVSIPTSDIVSYLMLRHYLEGLVLSILAIQFFLYAIEKNKICLAYIGAIFYLLACTAKELYVPLVILLPFLLDLKQKLCRKNLYPYIAAAIIYIIWRNYMLSGNLISGYNMPGLEITKPITFENILRLPFTIAAAMCWNTPWPSITMSAILLPVLIINKFSLKNFIIYSVFASCVILPFLPVLTILDLNPRYLFVFSFFFMILLGISLNQLINISCPFGINRFIVLLLGLSFLFSSVNPVDQRYESIKKYNDQQKTIGEFLLHNNNENVTYILEKNPHCLGNFSVLRETVYSQRSQTKISSEQCYIYHYYPDAEVWTYASLDNMKKLGQAKMVFKDKKCTLLADNLDISFIYFKPFFSWSLGPYNDGQYSFINNGAIIQVQRNGKILNPFTEDTSITVKYESPDNWLMYGEVYITLKPFSCRRIIYGSVN